MKYLLIFIFLMAISSCSTPDDNKHTSGIAIPATEEMHSIKTDRIKVNATFPFGCTDLYKLQYPKFWKGHEEGLNEPEGNEFREIGRCYLKINGNKTIGNLKAVNPEIINIGNDYNYLYYDSLASKNTDSCIYRLPDMGNFECYYFYYETKVKSYGIYGNLLLLNPSTGKSKLINIYNEFAGEQNINFRYFLTVKDTINLYEGSCYDDGCSMNKSYKITITPKGELTILKHK